MCVGVLDSHVQMRLESQSTGQTASALRHGAQHHTVCSETVSKPFTIIFQVQTLVFAWLLCTGISTSEMSMLHLAVPSSFFCALRWTCSRTILVLPRFGGCLSPEMSVQLPDWNLQGTERLAYQKTFWETRNNDGKMFTHIKVIQLILILLRQK